MSRFTRWWVAAGFAVCVASVVGGFRWWRSAQRNELLSISRPAVPDLSDRPVAFRERLSAVNERVGHGPAPMQAMIELSRLYDANGFLSEASACYEALLRVDASNAHWPYLLSVIQAGYGRLEGALPLVRRAIELDPDYPAARLSLGDILLKLNHPKEAALEYERLANIGEFRPFAQIGLVRCDIDAQRWTSARERLLQIVRDKPQFDPAWELLGTVNERLGNENEAEAARQRVTHRKPQSPDPWVEDLLGYCYDSYRLAVAAGAAQNSGNLGRATELLKRAAAVNPSDSTAMVELGKALAQRGDAEGALQNLKRSVAVSPGNANGWAALALFLAARGDAAGAEKTLAEGLAHCPDSPNLHLGNGRRLAQAGDLGGAAVEYRKVIRLRPDEADAYLDLAQVLFRLKLLDEARSTLVSVLSVQPEHPVAVARLAHLAITSGDESAARNWLQHVRQQPRVPSQVRDDLVAAFRKRFGSPP